MKLSPAVLPRMDHVKIVKQASAWSFTYDLLGIKGSPNPSPSPSFPFFLLQLILGWSRLSVYSSNVLYHQRTPELSMLSSLSLFALATLALHSRAQAGKVDPLVITKYETYMSDFDMIKVPDANIKCQDNHVR